MAGCWRAAALCLLPALLTTLGAAQEEQQPLPEQLLAQLQTSRDVYTALDLLRALNDTAGSPVGEVLTLQGRRLAGGALALRVEKVTQRLVSEAWHPAADDIYIHAQDLIAFQGSLPINGGNRIVVLRGGKAGASGGNPTVLDWGSSVNVMYHPSGHSFYAYNLILQARPLCGWQAATQCGACTRSVHLRALTLQGLAPASSGYSAGMSKQMVGGMFWPTYSGEPGHMVSTVFNGAHLGTLLTGRLAACVACCARCAALTLPCPARAARACADGLLEHHHPHSQRLVHRKRHRVSSARHAALGGAQRHRHLAQPRHHSGRPATERQHGSARHDQRRLGCVELHAGRALAGSASVP